MNNNRLYMILHGYDRNVEKNGYLWNSIQGIVNAAQSVVIMIVVMRVCGSTDGGIFTLAFSVANMMLFVGKYGTRSYQVTDYKEKYSFSEYVMNRICTTGIMFVVSVVYCLWTSYRNAYDATKTWVILMWCMVKVVDAFTDVLEGRLQQIGRIDISARLYVFRTVVSIGIALIVLFFSRDLLAATVTAFICEVMLAVFLNIQMKMDYGIVRWKGSWSVCLQLLVMCFPLFVYGFGNLFMTNAPKTAIDTVLGDEEQAMYGIIAMPVFVVNMLAQFVYNPILRTLGINYHNKEYQTIRKKIHALVWVVVGLTVICLGGGALLGVPVFNWMYNTEISKYKIGLLLLIAGGGAQALCTLFISALTVIRHQKVVTWVYLFFTIVSAFIFTPVIQQYHIVGGCICYLVVTLMIGISLGFLYEIRMHIIMKEST